MSDQIIPPLKHCHKCGHEYPLTEEFFCYNRHGNLGSPCRNCIANGKRKWRSEHPDLVKKHKSESQKRHRESANKRNKRYAESHTDLILAKRKYKAEANNLRAKNWYANNRERSALRSKEYNSRPEVIERRKERNRGKRSPNHVLIVVRYRARKRSLPDTFTAEDWTNCLAYFHDCCAICGRPQGLWHTLAMDHWIPLSDPDCPGTVVTNIVPLCHGDGGCNNSKSNRDPREWLVDKFGARRAAVILRAIETYFASVSS